MHTSRDATLMTGHRSQTANYNYMLYNKRNLFDYWILLITT